VNDSLTESTSMYRHHHRPLCESGASGLEPKVAAPLGHLRGTLRSPVRLRDPAFSFGSFRRRRASKHTRRSRDASLFCDIEIHD